MHFGGIIHMKNTTGHFKSTTKFDKAGFPEMNVVENWKCEWKNFVFSNIFEFAWKRNEPLSKNVQINAAFTEQGHTANVGVSHSLNQWAPSTVFGGLFIQGPKGLTAGLAGDYDLGAKSFNLKGGARYSLCKNAFLKGAVDSDKNVQLLANFRRSVSQWNVEKAFSLKTNLNAPKSVSLGMKTTVSY